MSLLEQLQAEEERRQAGRDTTRLSEDFSLFVREAWPALKPDEAYHHNWHIDAICQHLQAVSNGDTRRLQIWIPRASMKSMLVSIMWPAWEWTRKPGLRYWTASYELGLSGRLAGKTRDLMATRWYQNRWGHQFSLLKEGERYYSNNRGGTRLATAVGSTALGEHGHRIIIDDALNAAAADATSRVKLDEANEWYDATVMGSRADPTSTAIVIIMQRLHENDVAAHALEQQPEEWTILCLPEKYEPDHPYAWHGDPRQEGDLLWPSHRPDVESQAWVKSLGSHRAAGQAQQRPAAREGEILRRHWWRFYQPGMLTDPTLIKRRPRFRIVVQSIDTPLKDKETNDLVAIQAWGVTGADRYLIDLKKGHMSFHQARRAVLEQAAFVRKLYRSARHHILIENAGYGIELIDELKRELTGVVKITRAKEGDKILRAEAAAAVLESGNCFLPGYRTGTDEFSMPDEHRSPADIVDFIDNCAMFPNAKHDDDIDAWSQAMNWLNAKTHTQARTWSSFRSRR